MTRPVGAEAPASPISVVVPTYNRAGLIGATLGSILTQDAPVAEVIVVDDGSTDGTGEVLTAFESAVRTIRVMNGGDLVARNIGLRAAVTPLVAFCDSDDLWQPSFLTSMGELWRHIPELTAAFGNFQLVRDGRWDARTKFDDAPPDFWDGLQPVGLDGGVFDRPVVDRLLGFQPFFPSAMVVHRARFLNMGGWDEAVSRVVGCDFATVLRAAEQPIGIMRRSLVGIRKHSGNISGDVQAMNLGDAQVLAHVLATRPALALHRAAVMASISDRRAAAADIAFDRRDFGAVRDIQAMLPPSHLSLPRRVKGWISRLPVPVATRAADLASTLHF